MSGSVCLSLTLNILLCVVHTVYDTRESMSEYDRNIFFIQVVLRSMQYQYNLTANNASILAIVVRATLHSITLYNMHSRLTQHLVSSNE